MPWKEVTLMSLRKEFVLLAKSQDANISKLCRNFGISRKTGYKWINRFKVKGEADLADRSRKPKRSPYKTPKTIEDEVLIVRANHPAWGGRKIRSRLKALGKENIPAASTITVILKRYGRIDPEESLKHKPWQRFEADEPNDLWQMDFKGHFEAAQLRCHPLTVLDDHSRYSLALEACQDEKGETVRERLLDIFRRYGLPKKILVDNGSPWGSDKEHPYTSLTVWLIRQGIGIIHASAYHPQTLGKDERFHRTLKAEVLGYCVGLNIPACQRRFDDWRNIYNLQRPHESLDMAVPASRYRLSPRCYKEQLPQIEYAPNDIVRKVQDGGWISYRNREYRISRAFKGERVALRSTSTDGIMDIFFCNHKVAKIDFTDHN